MHHDTITLFNRQRNPSGDIWQPSVLTGVNVNMDRGAIVKVYGETAQDNIILNVPYQIQDDNVLVETKTGTKIWLPPKEWQRADDKAEKLTFTAGSAFDFLWFGDWIGGLIIYDDNYGDMSFYDYMLANYDYVFAVTSVGQYSVIPHFEVAGR